MPNWNSCTMPVTSPSAKLMRNSLPKNFASLIHCGLCVRTQAVWKTATMRDMPIVIGTKRKWYTVVMANCHRARSVASMRAPQGVSTKTT